MYQILTLNLGTTSSKVGFFHDEKIIDKRNIAHFNDDITRYPTMELQVKYRKDLILKWLEEIGGSMSGIDAIGLRVGAALPKEVGGGTFLVEGELEKDLRGNFVADRPLSHGIEIVLPLAEALSQGHDIPLYVVDPATINEMIPEARVAGHPLFVRDTMFHALNQKMVARKIAGERLAKKYEECDMIIAHLGGGVSVAVHEKGRVIDTNNCGGEEGSFSPARTGYLPVRQVIQLCYSGKYSMEEALELTMGKGGVFAYLGTSDMREVEKRIEGGDEYAELIYKSMAYRVAKEIGAGAAVLKGKVDAIIITGGLANSHRFSDLIKERVAAFAPVFVFPGDLESEALAAGILRVLRGEEQLQKYPRL